MRLACQMWVSSQILSPSLNIVWVSHMAHLHGEGINFDALITPPCVEGPSFCLFSSIWILKKWHCWADPSTELGHQFAHCIGALTSAFALSRRYAGTRRVS